MTEIGCIAISVSDPEPRELERRGLTADHVQHAMVELARQIFAAGGAIAYGGDLRKGGYTDTLIALLRTYSREDRPSVERFRQYLAAHVYEETAEEDLARLDGVATIVVVEGPPLGGEAGRAAGLKVMREWMSAETDGRIVLGGRLKGQSGSWPGIVEEAFLMAASGEPLFVLGGAGGAAERLVRARRGDWPDELTTEFQLEHTPAHAPAQEAFVGPDEDMLRGGLEGLDLHNGLSAAENEELQLTSDLDLMAALVMRGFERLHEAEEEREWPVT
jgi:hypothetical protein